MPGGRRDLRSRCSRWRPPSSRASAPQTKIDCSRNYEYNGWKVSNSTGADYGIAVARSPPPGCRRTPGYARLVTDPDGVSPCVREGNGRAPGRFGHRTEEGFTSGTPPSRSAWRGTNTLQHGERLRHALPTGGVRYEDSCIYAGASARTAASRFTTTRIPQGEQVALSRGLLRRDARAGGRAHSGHRGAATRFLPDRLLPARRARRTSRATCGSAGTRRSFPVRCGRAPIPSASCGARRGAALRGRRSWTWRSQGQELPGLPHGRGNPEVRQRVHEEAEVAATEDEAKREDSGDFQGKQPWTRCKEPRLGDVAVYVEQFNDTGSGGPE